MRDWSGIRDPGQRTRARGITPREQGCPGPCREDRAGGEAPAEAPAETPEELEEDKKEEEEEKEEMEGTAITREEVAVMIAEAIAALSDPKAEEVAEEVAEAEGVEAELSALKAELSEIKKQAAEKGLSHAAPSPKVEPVNLANLSISERVQVLHNKFSK